MQAVAIGDEVYVGGGANASQTDLNTVLKYNHIKDEWTRLPDHCVVLFGLCQFQGELLSIGGLPNDPAKVYCYNTVDKKWVESLKPMPKGEGVSNITDYCISHHCLWRFTRECGIVYSGSVLQHHLTMALSRPPTSTMLCYVICYHL